MLTEPTSLNGGARDGVAGVGGSEGASEGGEGVEERWWMKGSEIQP